MFSIDQDTYVCIAKIIEQALEKQQVIPIVMNNELYYVYEIHPYSIDLVVEYEIYRKFLYDDGRIGFTPRDVLNIKTEKEFARIRAAIHDQENRKKIAFSLLDDEQMTIVGIYEYRERSMRYTHGAFEEQ